MRSPLTPSRRTRRDRAEHAPCASPLTQIKLRGHSIRSGAYPVRERRTASPLRAVALRRVMRASLEDERRERARCARVLATTRGATSANGSQRRKAPRQISTARPAARRQIRAAPKCTKTTRRQREVAAAVAYRTNTPTRRRWRARSTSISGRARSPSSTRVRAPTTDGGRRRRDRVIGLQPVRQEKRRLSRRPRGSSALKNAKSRQQLNRRLLEEQGPPRPTISGGRLRTKHESRGPGSSSTTVRDLFACANDRIAVCHANFSSDRGNGTTTLPTSAHQSSSGSRCPTCCATSPLARASLVIRGRVLDLMRSSMPSTTSTTISTRARGMDARRALHARLPRHAGIMAAARAGPPHGAAHRLPQHAEEPERWCYEGRREHARPAWYSTWAPLRARLAERLRGDEHAVRTDFYGESDSLERWRRTWGRCEEFCRSEKARRGRAS